MLARGECPVTVERKFVAAGVRVHEARCLLDLRAAPDPAFARGSVHSVYFDSPRRQSLAEKDGGDFLKRKVRLRWYNAATQPEGPVYLEIKDRLGGGRRKQRRRLSWPARRLHGLDLADPGFAQAVRAEAGELAPLIPADFQPLLGLRYERRRYVCAFTGARMCLDFEIAVTHVNALGLPAASCPSLAEAVFEFKEVGPIEVPWLGELARCGFRARSFSKYGACLHRVLDGGAPA